MPEVIAILSDTTNSHKVFRLQFHQLAQEILIQIQFQTSRNRGRAVYVSLSADRGEFVYPKLLDYVKKAITNFVVGMETRVAT